jgi:hypothetical protein
MNYYLDTEFLEGTQTKRFLGLPYGNTKPTIDLISIGLVSEDNREYYAISKDFNLKEAWNRYDIKEGVTKPKYMWDRKIKEDEKVYWIRENVLKPIFIELTYKEADENNDLGYTNVFNFQTFKRLIERYGKTNQQIAKEIKDFVSPVKNMLKYIPDHLAVPEQFKTNYSKPKFYGYYADFDWTVFAWLFGKMIDLPAGFPMYCIDLKQELDNKALLYFKDRTLEQNISYIKNRYDYPKQTNEHNALADARWNKELHNFLNIL